MAREMTSAVPKDDDEPIEAVDEVETVEAKDEDAAADGDTAPVIATADADADASAEDLEALVGEDNPRGIPKSRFDEVNNERKALAEQNAILARALAEREPKAVVETAKPRDFDAELAALKEKYKSGDLDMDEYLEKREAVTDARSDAKVAEKIKPVAEKLEQEHARILNERLTADLAKAAAKAFEKYPFLNIESDDKNDEAIAKVIAERDELIAAGIAPVKALRLAVASVAPDYVTATEATPAKVDDVAAARKLAAQKKAAAASVQQPAALRGSGDRIVDTSEHVSGSVKDHAAWEARQRAQATH